MAHPHCGSAFLGCSGQNGDHRWTAIRRQAITLIGPSFVLIKDHTVRGQHLAQCVNDERLAVYNRSVRLWHFDRGHCGFPFWRLKVVLGCLLAHTIISSFGNEIDNSGKSQAQMHSSFHHDFGP
jgi:hypothetical protein